MAELQTRSSDETPPALLKSEAESLLKNILPYVEPLGDYFAVKPDNEQQVKKILGELMYAHFELGLVGYKTLDQVIHKIIGRNNQPLKFTGDLVSEPNVAILTAVPIKK